MSLRSMPAYFRYTYVMVNPYQPSQETGGESDDAATTRPLPRVGPRFLGGIGTVLLIGAISGAAMFAWGVAAGTFFNDPAGPLLGWSVLFFGMNLALMYFLRGVNLASSTKLGCAALLTPVSMILFVPVCIGVMLSISTVSSTVPRSMRFSGGYETVMLLVVSIFGFVIIAAIVAAMVRSWATTRLARQAGINIQPSGESEKPS